MGRTLWINKLQSFGTKSATGVAVADVLSDLDTDIRARATLVNIRGTIIHAYGDPSLVGTWQVGMGLVIGPVGGLATAPDVLDTSQDHSWLWTDVDFYIGTANNVAADRTRLLLNVKSARRFRGGQTLLFITQSVLEMGAVTVDTRAYLRMLLYVP